MLVIKTYEGGGRELSDFITPIWRETFKGRRLTLDWDADYFEWQLLAGGEAPRDYLLAAYDGGRLVGTLLGEPFRFWLRGRGECEAAVASWFTVDPAHRQSGVGSKLADEMQRRLRERGAPFLFGFAIRGTVGQYYWESAPGSQILGRVGFWCRIFDVKAVRDCLYAGLFDRVTLSILNAVQNPHPRPADTDGIRDYRPEDLPRALELVNGMRDGVDVSYVWDEPRLRRQLMFKGVPRTLVYEERGRVEGLLNYYPINFDGRTTLRSAFIDLLAFGSASYAARKKLLRAAMAQMIREGIEMALLLRVPCFASRPLWATGFVPLPEEFQIVAGFSEPGLTLPRTKRLHAHLR
ncbi:MAG TPA: GNAT family N-acetyltransferase [Pyrinomonadaceae bacterium]|jgi:GNAT superfamily N-acetyltransferase